MPTHNQSRADGFTLVELLVVIIIIAVLITISLVAGQRVVASGRDRLTADTIRVLDMTLEEYIAQKGKIPPLFADDHRAETDPTYENWRWPASDVMYGKPGAAADGELANSVGWYLHLAEQVPGLTDTIAGMDAKLVKQITAGTGNLQQPPHATVMDAWGNPIRYVHPALDGVFETPDRTATTQGTFKGIIGLKRMNPALPGMLPLGLNSLRRSVVTDAQREERKKQGLDPIVGDSDGGLCPGDRPYFYSAGADEDPSTTDNNVYSIEPTFLDPG